MPQQRKVPRIGEPRLKDRGVSLWPGSVGAHTAQKPLRGSKELPIKPCMKPIVSSTSILNTPIASGGMVDNRLILGASGPVSDNVMEPANAVSVEGLDEQQRDISLRLSILTSLSKELQREMARDVLRLKTVENDIREIENMRPVSDVQLMMGFVYNEPMGRSQSHPGMGYGNSHGVVGFSYEEALPHPQDFSVNVPAPVSHPQGSMNSVSQRQGSFRYNLHDTLRMKEIVTVRPVKEFRCKVKRSFSMNNLDDTMPHNIRDNMLLVNKSGRDPAGQYEDHLSGGELLHVAMDDNLLHETAETLSDECILFHARTQKRSDAKMQPIREEVHDLQGYHNGFDSSMQTGLSCDSVCAEVGNTPIAEVHKSMGSRQDDDLHIANGSHEMGRGIAALNEAGLPGHEGKSNIWDFQHAVRGL